MFLTVSGFVQFIKFNTQHQWTLLLIFLPRKGFLGWTVSSFEIIWIPFFQGKSFCCFYISLTIFFSLRPINIYFSINCLWATFTKLVFTLMSAIWSSWIVLKSETVFFFRIRIFELSHSFLCEVTFGDKISFFQSQIHLLAQFTWSFEDPRRTD